VLLQHGTIAQVVVDGQPRVVHEDVEGLDALDGRLDLRRLGDVEHERCHAFVGCGQRPARARVDAGRTSPERLLDEGVPDATVGSGDENRLSCDHDRTSS
jgi:hypothetical protein